jgi:hypothetical protein
MSIIEVNNVKPILHFFDSILTVMPEIPCLKLYIFENMLVLSNLSDFSIWWSSHVSNYTYSNFFFFFLFEIVTHV